MFVLVFMLLLRGKSGLEVNRFPLNSDLILAVYGDSMCVFICVCV